MFSTCFSESARRKIKRGENLNFISIRSLKDILFSFEKTYMFQKLKGDFSARINLQIPASLQKTFKGIVDFILL